MNDDKERNDDNGIQPNLYTVSIFFSFLCAAVLTWMCFNCSSRVVGAFFVLALATVMALSYSQAVRIDRETIEKNKRDKDK